MTVSLDHILWGAKNDLLPWRQELQELLSRSGADPIPALRRSNNPDWLFACDLRRVSPEAIASFHLLAVEAGWETSALNGWLHLRREDLLSPGRWLPLLPEGEEPDALRHLLFLHPALLPDPQHIWDLLKALELSPDQIKHACRQVHCDLAVSLRKAAHTPLSDH